MKEVFPKYGGEWTRSLRWWFIPNFHLHIIVFENDKFFAAIKRAWWSMKDNLQQVLHNSMDEWLHQPLIWNPLFLDDEGSMLGRRVRLNWAQVDSSSGASLSKWRRFVHDSTNIMQQEYR